LIKIGSEMEVEKARPGRDEQNDENTARGNEGSKATLAWRNRHRGVTKR
jgi:hypothetical protein